MKNAIKIVIYFLTFNVISGCRKPYTPPEITSPGTFLVVEGVINTGSDSTVISLSHTVSISGKTVANPQTKAIVTVESDQNATYSLTEITGGKYISTGLNLDNARQYRLRIKTLDNRQYVSDFVAVKITPQIDSIGFNIDNVRGGVQVYVNAHDVGGKTRYYRWDYTETWAFHSRYTSGFVTNGTAIGTRTPSQLVYNCFASAPSTNILIASSAALQQDIIYQTPLSLIPSTSEKIETRYSILLHQYALTGDAYNFWSNIKKNTEELGSIFDAQPSTAIGNIHNTNNPSEVVIGYISASTVQTKRIFISNSQLPQTWVTIYPYQCNIDSIFSQRIPELIPLKNTEIPLYMFITPTNLTGFSASSSNCVDCTIRGFTKPPSFW